MAIAPEVTLQDAGAVTAHWIDEIGEGRRTTIEPLWREYQQGNFTIAFPTSTPAHVELVPTHNLLVESTFDASGQPSSVAVRNMGSLNLQGTNFMGFHTEQRCLAFRGQTRFLKTFQDFASNFVKEDHIVSVLQTPINAEFPPEGLPAGLEYEEFAGRVEIVEYVVWLKEADTEHEPGGESITILGVTKEGVEIDANDVENTDQISYAGDAAELSSLTDAGAEVLLSSDLPDPKIFGDDGSPRRPTNISPLTEAGFPEALNVPVGGSITLSVEMPPPAASVEADTLAQEPSRILRSRTRSSGRDTRMREESADELSLGHEITNPQLKKGFWDHKENEKPMLIVSESENWTKYPLRASSRAPRTSLAAKESTPAPVMEKITAWKKRTDTARAKG